LAAPLLLAVPPSEDIGTNDQWIAAASIRHELPLVTANVAEFSRVDGLEVLPYR